MSVEENLKPSILLISPSDIESDIKKIEEELKIIHNDSDDKILKLKEDVQRLWNFVEWLKIAQVQGIWKSKTCRYSDNGKCNAWNVNEPEKLGLPSEVIEVDSNSSKHVIVDKFPNFCIACPLYEAKAKRS
ncbi:hypothetical protein GWK48_04255 [Metallosphaera tengchongensis]|uniref:Uncharacterized protein n=1 Tax=Metallosphaera tengchongensis TaxID=1532350 RepID=A0A6N0NWH9_9CREN|nr:hypothetical protein [Metallosphaera tengchongensis]QKQ99707.1 hypothetical protein GWK48_04255 [Metallosphaera tengchongensis]